MALVVYSGGANASSYFESWDDDPKTERYVGLSNQGATCYLNGLLQTLFMTPDFRRALYVWRYEEDKHGKEEECITLQLQRLFGFLQIGKQKAVTTTALTKSFGWEGSEAFQQQDVQELKMVLFDAIEQDFKGTESEAIIDRLFAGEYVDYLRCLDVDYETERADKFTDFAVNIIPFGSTKALGSLIEGIETYLRPELLEGDNRYKVESMSNALSDAIKGLKFCRLPPIMFVQLKRFTTDYTSANFSMVKLNNIVKFPLVLDMNKYVSGKRARTASFKAEKEETAAAAAAAAAAVEGGGAGGGGSTATPCLSRRGSEDGVTNDEFEAFLQEQFALLRSKATENEESKEGDGSAEKESKSSSSGGGGGGGGGDVDVDDLPDLVDVQGKKSPDQIEEEAKKEEDEKYLKLTNEDIPRLLETRGEWIYELYAVLIHSGAIAGGHYYAYIKDLDSQKWWNFNDSNVTEISEEKVKEGWGGTTTYSATSYNNSSWAGGSYNSYYADAKVTKTTTLSCANAYMLAYRKVSKSGASSIPDDALIPQYIKDAVKKEEEEAQRKKKAEEERLNQVTVKMMWKGKEVPVQAKKTDTYLHLLESIWNKLELAKHEDFVDWEADYEREMAEKDAALGEQQIKIAEEANANSSSSSSSSSSLQKDLPASGGEEEDAKDTNGTNGSQHTGGGEQAKGDEKKLSTIPEESEAESPSAPPSSVPPSETTPPPVAASSSPPAKPTFPRNRLRLRQFDIHSSLPKQALDVDLFGHERLTSKDLLLDSLYIKFYLEVRRVGEQWEEYIVDGINLYITWIDPLATEINKSALFLSKTIRLRKSATVGDLRKLIAPLVPHLSKIRILRLLEHNNPIKPVAFREDDIKLMDCRQFPNVFWFVDNTKIYVEEEKDEEEVVVSSDVAGSGQSSDVDGALTVKVSTPLEQISPCYAVFLEQKCALLLKYNKPPSNLFECTFEADKRWLVSQLRTKIAAELQVSPEELRLHKFQKNGQEIKDVDYMGPLTLERALINQNLNIFCCLGKVLPAGAFLLAVSLYTPTSCPARIHMLPDMDKEETYETAGCRITLTKGEECECTMCLAIAKNKALKSQGENGSSEGEGVKIEDLLETIALEGASSSSSAYSLNDEDTSNVQVAVAEAHVVESGDDDSFSSFSTMATVTATATVVGVAVAVQEDEAFSGSNNDGSPNEKEATAVVAVEATAAEASEKGVDDEGWKGGLAPGEETSLFGEMKTDLMPTAGMYQSIPEIDDLMATKDTDVATLKSTLREKLVALKKIDPETPAEHLRLRIRHTVNKDSIFSPTTFLRDGPLLKSELHWHGEGKGLAVQVLDHPETIKMPTSSISDTGDTIVYVQRWHRDTWTLGERKEFFLPGNMSVREIARRLGLVFDIPLRRLRSLVVTKNSDVYISKLNQSVPGNEKWTNLSQDSRLLSLAKRSLMLSEGDLLLLQDQSEPLRQLTNAEQLSIEVADKENSYSTGTLFDQPYSYASSTTKWPSTTRSGGGGGGVKIKTHRHRVEEEKKSSSALSQQDGEGGSPVTSASASSAAAAGGEGGEVSAMEEGENYDSMKESRSRTSGDYSLFGDLDD